MSLKLSASAFGTTEANNEGIIQSILQSIRGKPSNNNTGIKFTTKNVSSTAFGGKVATPGALAEYDEEGAVTKPGIAGTPGTDFNRDGLDDHLNLQQMARTARIKALAINSPEQMLLGKAVIIDKIHADAIKIRDQLVGLGMETGWTAQQATKNATEAFVAYKTARLELFGEVYTDTIAEQAHNQKI